MLPKHEGILRTGQWEDGKPNRHLYAIGRAVRSFFEFVQPAILTKSGPRQTLRRTAYLDGLRGFAALMVYWMHHQLWAHTSSGSNRILENGYGYDQQYYFVCLPVIRTFFSGGHYAVTIFFVISGYVLSTKPLTLMAAGEVTKLGDALASALFRRWLRLYIPVIMTTILYLTSWHIFGTWTERPHASTYREELWNWYTEFKNFSFVFRSGGDPTFSYNVHTWSIQIEFKGSVIIYTALMAFSRCTRNARLWCEIGLIYYFLYIADGAFGSMFMGGMLLCDLDMLARTNDLPRFFNRFKGYKDLIFNSLFMLSILLGGVPAETSDVLRLRNSPGWYFLSFLKPQAVLDYKNFYLFWAAIFLVASIPHISWLKAFFETRFNQYLGRISFAFYLVHGPILFTLGDRLYLAAGWKRQVHDAGLPDWIDRFPLSKSGPFGLELAFLLPQLILFPATLWLGEIVTKALDEPSIRLTQWLYQRTLAAPAKS